MNNAFKYGDIAYHDVQLVNRTQMSNLSINPYAWAEMASALQIIPVSISECQLVCKTLPIVFSPAGHPMPIAITSFSPQKNALFTDGRWKQGHYIPLAAKRYPFALTDANEDKKQLLYVDTHALENNDGESREMEAPDYRLFDDEGNNTETLNEAIKQCKALDEQIKATTTIVEVINQAGLFKETQLVITDKEGKESKTSPFKVIDREKLSQLSDEHIVTLQKHRGLWLIHAHMISMTNIEAIARQTL